MPATLYNDHMPEILRLYETDMADAVERCREVLDKGGLVLLPTDTVYGLAAKADDPAAVARIFGAKGRDEGKPLVVMVPSREDAEKLAVPDEREALRRLGALWPGPLTLVFRAADTAWRAGAAPRSERLGVRVPDSPFLLRLLALTGPLAVTSANPSGNEPPASLGEVDGALLREVDAAVDGERGGSGQPSTVVAISGGRIEILRRGEIGEEALREALEAT